MGVRTLVLAFDIESAGVFRDVIGLGMCVMDDQLRVYEKRFWPAYFPNATQFEPRCQREFWVHHPKVLEHLTYRGSASPEQCRQEMIAEFWDLRKRWETYAAAQGYGFQLVCDNAVFDAAELNKLAERHLPDAMPMPYMASTRAYGNLFETFNMERGLLMAVDPLFRNEWGLSHHIATLYVLPPPPVQADHCPENDAHEIAYDMHMLNGIQEGRYLRRTL